MRWCYKIYIVGIFVLQFQKYLCKAFNGNLLAESPVGDILILTVYTAHIAAGKKHRAAAIFGRDAGFFPMVQCRTGYFYGIGHFAVADRGVTVGIAVSRT